MFFKCWRNATQYHIGTFVILLCVFAQQTLQVVVCFAMKSIVDIERAVKARSGYAARARGSSQPGNTSTAGWH